MKQNISTMDQRKKLNFDLKKFQKFKDKINYIVLEDQPRNLHSIKEMK